MGFLTGQLVINVYDDVSDTNFPLINIPLINRIWKNGTVTQQQFAKYALVASGSISVNVNNTAPTRMYLYSDEADINVNINGLGNLLFTSGEPAYLPATVTSLVITNTSASVPITVEVGFITI